MGRRRAVISGAIVAGDRRRRLNVNSGNETGFEATTRPQLPPRAPSNGSRKDGLGLQKADIQVWIADSSIELSKSLPLKALIVRLSHLHHRSVFAPRTAGCAILKKIDYGNPKPAAIARCARVCFDFLHRHR
jgi:hypothetical protein